MIQLRSFTPNDAAVLQKFYEQPTEEIISMIGRWNEKTFGGRYFEMFAVCNGEEIVGMVSLYQHSEFSISAGPEIFSEHRRKGYGAAALELAYEIAGQMGYKTASAQIRTDNTASIHLHEKLGFHRDCEMLNRKGNAVYIYLKPL